MRLLSSLLFITVLNATASGNSKVDFGYSREFRTGCLAVDRESNTFILTESTGREVVVAGLSEVKEPVNHIVRLRDARSSDGWRFDAVALVDVESSGAERPKSEAFTADQQGRNAVDRKTSQAIRRAVVSDKSLSMYAHNVKIISREGAVTLRGPVRSDREKRVVEQMAVSIAGPGRVHNELTVEPKELGEQPR